MKKLQFKRSRLIPDISSKENKRIFLWINIALIIGGLSIVSTLLYLILNLEKADQIIYYCLPGSVFGILLIIIYAIGYRKLMSKSIDIPGNNEL